MSYFNLWLTGLSGSGKTTIAEKVSDCLTDISINNEVLDGDVYRAFLSPDTGYSEKERNAFRKKVIVLAGIFNKTRYFLYYCYAFIKSIRKDTGSSGIIEFC